MKRFMQLLLSIGVGYFINYIFLVLSVLIFGGFLFGSTMSSIGFIRTLAFFLAPYGTGIGLAIELVFKDKTFLEKLFLSFVAIGFSPWVVFCPIFSFLELISISNFDEFSLLYFLFLSLIGIFTSWAYMYYRHFTKKDILTFLISYFSVFIGFLFTSLFLSIISLKGIDEIGILFNISFSLSFASLAFYFSSVLLKKLKA